MYGWPRGIIFSKLAFNVSFIAASVPNSTVSTRQTIITMRRRLKTRRSRREPELMSKFSNAGWSAPVVGVCICDSSVCRRQRAYAARTCDNQRAAVCSDHGCRWQRLRHRLQRETLARVITGEHVSGLADDDETAIGADRSAGHSDLQARRYRLPGCAAIDAA